LARLFNPYENENKKPNPPSNFPYYLYSAILLGRYLVRPSEPIRERYFIRNYGGHDLCCILATSRTIQKEMRLFIDVETFSSVDLKKSGVYPYFESPDFEVLLVGYCVEHGPIHIFKPGESKSDHIFFDLLTEADELVAHNATFERLAFSKIGFPLKNWTCTMVRSAYCGLPASLEEAGKALNLRVKKDAAGKALIRYWSLPCKPTKANGFRTRNLPEHDPERWQAFKEYLRDDVATTRELHKALEKYPFTEQENYLLDQKINDFGVGLDADLIRNAIELDKLTTHKISVEARKLTGLDNPNSLTQLASWLTDHTGEEIESLNKDAVKDMLASAEGDVKRALELRLQSSNTSVKKYMAGQHYTCKDGRARGLFQFYGAGRTGRWAGRGIQLQNMPRNYMRTLKEARELVRQGDFETLDFLYSDTQQVLKELTRTMLVPSPGSVFLVADFSAIEARVLAWLAGETWRLDVFRTHGKIYEASASAMFGVPIESIDKGSPYRQKGKIAELALGYQGGVGALKQMGGEAMGLSELEMKTIVTRWRKANPAISAYWGQVEDIAKQALEYPNERVTLGHLAFTYARNTQALLIYLPSGRPLIYQKPKLSPGRFGESVKYYGVNQETRQFGLIDTYGGKLVENIVQAVARDLLAFSLISVDRALFRIAMHVHDEIVVESPEAERLPWLLETMTKKPKWAGGLPLAADGFACDFYQKD
jgi:DNA polymerase